MFLLMNRVCLKKYFREVKIKIIENKIILSDLWRDIHLKVEGIITEKDIVERNLRFKFIVLCNKNKINYFQ